MTGAGTLSLRASLPDILQSQLFVPYGQDVTLHFPASASNLWGSASPTETTLTVRGAILPAGAGAVSAAQGSGLPVPSFELYVLTRDADLGIPGWHAQWAGVRYYPVADARDEGSQGIVWFVPLSGPQQIGAP